MPERMEHNVLQGMNAPQLEAATHRDGPLLILAGAGSGKTRVLTNRIAWLVEEQGVSPWNILAITFTNKAAGEMKARVEQMVEHGGDAVWVSTFHSTCARILRRHIELLGYNSNYTIYDSDDQKSLMKDVCVRLRIDTKIYKERTFLNAISHAKDELISPQVYRQQAQGDFDKERTAAVYEAYQQELARNNALDFDDLICKMVELFERFPEVLNSYQERFQYILVDEYQDTNTAQFRLVQLLAEKYRNLCVVGDDDQSIYRFRGANIQNILNFEKYFPDAKVIRLEQNYRSTSAILNAANAVIAHNVGRKRKTLWTANGDGKKVQYRQFQAGYEEAQYVAQTIGKRVASGEHTYQDFAVLYRTNAQSRLLEEKLLLAGIPYKIVGGINFYARREIKDLLSYLKTIDNASDDLSVRRIINVPKRGVGATAIARVQDYAIINNMTFFDALGKAREIPGNGRSAAKQEAFVEFIRVLRAKAGYLPVSQLLQEVIESTGYVTELEADGSDEAKDRIANIDELISKVAAYEHGTENPTLSGFLQDVALVADIDSYDEKDGYVVLMTLHSAKGLEFPCVFLTGLEDGTFPSYMSIVSSNPTEELEEERRLCYVGITRAMQELTLTGARSRMIRGQVQYNNVSRFLREIPEELLDTEEETTPFGGGRSALADRERVSFGRWSQDDRGQESSGKPKTPYQQARTAFREKAFSPQQFRVTKAASLDYTVGDRVSHVKFGQGTVQSITDGGRDYEVTVLFDKYGVKKMFASFAKLKLV